MAKTKADFELDTSPFRSIEDIVRQEYFGYSQTYKGKAYPRQEATLDEILKRVYQHIESEAIKRFKSNELWAIKAWTYDNILTGSVAKEAAATDETLLNELTQPIADWQSRDFDPLTNMRRKLSASGRKEYYIRECMRVANYFVARYGKKSRYSQDDILEFLESLDKRYEKKGGDQVITPGRETSSYVTKVTQFKRFLESLPEDEKTGRKQVIPFEVPNFPDKFNQPAFTPEEIDNIIYAAIMDERPTVALRIALATIYGCRCGEIAKMTNQDIILDHGNPTVNIPTEKKGKREPQPIPQELVPLFTIPLNSVSKQQVITQLKRVCRKAGVRCGHGTGIHAIRRSVVTALYNSTVKEISIYRFMRWSTGGRGGGMGVILAISPHLHQTQVCHCHW